MRAIRPAPHTNANAQSDTAAAADATGSSHSVALKQIARLKRVSSALVHIALVAEEVASVNPDLVVRDNKGELYTVRYDAVNAMLLNEFLKEHRKVQRLEKQVEMLTPGLTKVSAQLEASKPASQVVSRAH